MATSFGDAFTRLSPAGPKACKICGELAPVQGEVDFNKSCHEIAGTILPRSGIGVAYNRCAKCEFLFSASFDGWVKQDFLDKIYNEQYATVDPDYKTDRPSANAGFLTRLFEKHRATLSILDYGGGNGTLARLLQTAGFRSALTYDPLVAEFASMPRQRFAVVTSFETLEHTPDPLGAIAEIAALTDEPGVVVFSTLVQPADFAAQGLGWWYVGPRNGHISIFSRKSLVQAWRRHGFTLGHFNDNAHIAFRKIPDFARHILKSA